MAFHGDAKGSWLFGWRLEKPLSIGELINHKKGLLAKIGFPKSQLIVATTGFNLAYEDLPLAAQNFFSEDGKLPDGDMEVAEGVNLIGTLTPGILPKNVQSTANFSSMARSWRRPAAISAPKASRSTERSRRSKSDRSTSRARKSASRLVRRSNRNSR